MTDSNSSSGFSNKSNNPQNTPKTSFWPPISFDTASNLLAASLLVANWAYPMYHLDNLPANIPITTPFKRATDWSVSKYFILLLPVNATIAYYQIVHGSIDPKMLPVKVPQGANAQKVSKIAQIFWKVSGTISQVALLAASALLVKGVNVDQSTRASWLQKGIAAVILAALSTCVGVHIALRK